MSTSASIDVPATGGKAPALWRRLLLWLLVIGLIWAVVIFAWRVNDTDPAAHDLVLWLLVLPLALIVSFYLLRAGVRRLRQPRVAGVTEAASTPDPNDVTAVEAPQINYRLHLCGSALQLAAGASADEVLQALAEPKRPSLHPQLKDDHGLPVFAAPVDGLDPGTVAAAIAPVMRDSADFEQLFDEQAQRALALLDPVAEELLLAELAALPAPVGEPNRSGLPDYVMAHSASGRAAGPRPAAPMLRVSLLLPADWSTLARQAVADWLLAKARAVGLDVDRIGIDAIGIGGPQEVWRVIDQIGLAQHRMPNHDRHLLLAAQSQIGEGSVEQLEESGVLFASSRQQGIIPGEGAAGVLLTAPAAPLTADAAAPLQLQRPVLGQAAHSNTSRAAVRATSELVDRAFANALVPSPPKGVPASDAIKTVVSDADQRTSRSSEVAGVIAAQLPELEPMQHGRNLGLACGELGIVAPLALLALAAAQAARDTAPVLALSVADDTLRAALVVSPMLVPVTPGSA